MEISLESPSDLERRMTVRVPSERLEQEFDGRLRKLARKAKVPGFRPGRATLDAVRQRYGNGLRQEVVDDLLAESLRDALRDQQLQPVGRPQVESCNDTLQGLEYAVFFEVWPELGEIDWKGLKIERKRARVTIEDIDRNLENLRMRRAKWNETQRPAQNGDRLRFNYRGVDAQGKRRLGENGVQAALREGVEFPHQMDEKLRGMKAGENVEYPSAFPEDWKEAALRGQPLTMHLELKSVQEAELPELDREFFQAYGVDEGGEEELRRQMRRQLESAAEDAAQDDIKTQAMDGLSERHANLPLPRGAVRREAAVLRKRMGAPLESEHDTGAADANAAAEENAAADEKDPFIRIAERNMRLSLALTELQGVLNIQSDAELVRSAIEREAASYKNPQEIVRWYYSNQEALQKVQAAVVEKQLIERIMAEAEVSEKELSFEELMSARGD